MGCHFLLQGSFPTQGSKLCLLCLLQLFFSFNLDFPGGSDGKESASNSGDPGLIPGSGRSSGEGDGHLLQYSCLENPMDRGSWWAAVHGVTKSRTRLTTSLTQKEKGKEELYKIKVCVIFFSPGKNTGMDCHSLLQRIFPTQGSNPGLLHCR